MVEPIWAPGVKGPEHANTARVRDYWLDGSHHTAADRELADEIVVCAPHLPYLVRTHRALLGRMVRYLAMNGVRQFLDLGSGLPTAGNVHEVAQAIDPTCRVLYVDIDPVVAAEGDDLLAGNDNAASVCANLLSPDQVLDVAERHRLIDLDQPVAVLLLDVLHFVPDTADPRGVVAAYAKAACSGSYLAVSHTCQDQGIIAAMALYARMFPSPVPELTFRDPATVAEFCTGLDLLEPGVVPVPLWRPESEQDTGKYPELFEGCAVLAHKP